MAEWSGEQSASKSWWGADPEFGTWGLVLHLIKISNYLIEQPQTLQALMVDVRFRVEFLKVGDRCEEDTDAFI